MQNIIKIMDREDKDTSYRNRGVTLMGVHALEFIKDYVKQHKIPPTPVSYTHLTLPTTPYV